MTHISKKLAEWLKERGCEIESTAYYYRCRGGSNVRLKDCVWEEWEFVEGRIDWEAMIVDDGINPREEQCLPAYSWYDILVTYSKEFWGEEGYYDISTNKFTGMVSVTQIDTLKHGGKIYWNSPAEMTEGLLYLLRQGKTQEAEGYVKKHSLFAKQDL